MRAPRARHASFMVAAVLLLAPTLLAAPAPAGHAWIAAADDPDALRAALDENADKVPPEFHDRLDHAFDDGSLRVMVALTERTPAVERFAQENTLALDWYGNAARYMALVTPDHVASLLDNPAVLFVEPDYPVTFHMAMSAIDVNVRAREAVDPDALWRYDAATDTLVSTHPSLLEPLTGAGVVVSVVDSGIDKTHRDFGGWDCQPGPYEPCDSRIDAAVVLDHVSSLGNGLGGDLPTTDLASGHGTHVAGTIAGNGYYARDGGADGRYGGDGVPIGVAPEARLVSVKAGDARSAAFAVDGLQWTLDHADEYDIRITSNSWGCTGGCSYTPNSALGHVLRDLYRAGLVSVFAVGNDGGSGSGAEFSGYAQSPYVIGVANYDHATHRLAESSSRGSSATGNTLADPATWTPEEAGAQGIRRPDVAAPGTSIWAAASLTSSGLPRVSTSDVNGGPTQCCIVPYIPKTGTSMAAPHVSGALALLIGACDSAGPVDLMRAVFAGADPSRVSKTGAGATAEPFEVGYGGLDVRASVDWLLDQWVCGGTQNPPAPEAEPEDEPTSSPSPSSAPPSPKPTNAPGGTNASSPSNETAGSTSDEDNLEDGADPSPSADAGRAQGMDPTADAPGPALLLVLAAAAVATLVFRRRRPF